MADMALVPPGVRPYMDQDRAAVIAMLAEADPWKRLGYTATHWQRLFDPFPAGREGYVIESPSGVAGMAMLRRRFLFGDYLELLVVALGAQRQGLGRALLQAVERSVFAESKNLFACVSDFNDRARAFYRDNGYREVGPLPDLLLPGSSEILIRKTTGPAKSG